MVKQIETKEIRGVSAKTLIAIVTSTVIICGALFGFSNKITAQQQDTRNEIQLLRAEKVSESRLNDLRLRMLEDQNKLTRLEIDALKFTLNDMKRKLNIP